MGGKDNEKKSVLYFNVNNIIIKQFSYVGYISSGRCSTKHCK